MVEIRFAHINCEEISFAKMLSGIMEKSLPTRVAHKDGRKYYDIRPPTVFYLTDGRTLDFLRRKCRINYVKTDIEEANRQMESGTFDVKTLLEDGEKGFHTSGLLAFCVFMGDYLELTEVLHSQSVDVDFNEPAIFISPERIYDVTHELIRRFPLKKRKSLDEEVAGFVLFHEIAHMTFDPRGEWRDLRLSEGFANWFAWKASDDEGKKTVDRISLLNRDLCYNYYHILKYLDQIDSIIEHCLQNRHDLAVRRFYELVSHQPMQEASGGRLVVSGNINGFAGFGATDCKVFAGGKIAAIGNVRGGVICAHEIGILTGFLPESVRVYANKINFVDCYESLPSHIMLVPRSMADFREIIKPGLNVDRFLGFLRELKKSSRDAHPQLPDRGSLYYSSQLGENGVEVKPGERAVWVEDYIGAYLDTYLEEVKQRLPGREHRIPFVKGYPYSVNVFLSEASGMAIQLIPRSEREVINYATFSGPIADAVKFARDSGMNAKRFKQSTQGRLRLRGDEESPTVIIKGSRTEQHWTREDGIRDARLDALKDIRLYGGQALASSGSKSMPDVFQP